MFGAQDLLTEFKRLLAKLQGLLQLPGPVVADPQVTHRQQSIWVLGAQDLLTEFKRLFLS